jgi:hypothetical protein
MKLFATVCAVLLSLRVGGAQARLESVDPESVSAAARAALSDVTELNQLECSIAWTKPAMAIDLRLHPGSASPSRRRSLRARPEPFARWFV